MDSKRSARRTAKADASRHAQLTVVAGGPVGQRYTVENDCVIGRGEDADFELEHEVVSRHHARILCSDRGTFWLEDLGSTNGTSVNGELTKGSALRPGDEICLGGQVLLMFTEIDAVDDELRRRQRLEALGRLTAGVTHDLNNMLAAVLTGLEHVRGSELDADSAACLEDVWSAAKRAAELVPRLLAFARTDDDGGVVDVSGVCTEAVRLLERTLPRSIRIQAQIAPDMRVLGSSVELHQVLMNLCLNARDAMPDSGLLRITLSSAPQRRLAITVCDSGNGMTPEVKRRVFEPFFTTKKKGAGFGLGLATVREIVLAHGGSIRVMSAVARGTTVRIELPRVSSQTARATNVTNRPLVKRAAGAAVGTILVVDDEDLVRRGLLRLLKRVGFSVLEAQDGPAAIATVARGERPDFVILDLDMPTMSGEETYRELRRVLPDIRVLVATGHADGKRVEGALRAGAIGCIRKPFTADELFAAIASGRSRSDARQQVTPLRQLKHIRMLNASRTLRTDLN